MRGRVPEPCQHCAWYRGAGECTVFVELMPQGWRTPDGRCEAFADLAKQRIINEQMARYAGRQAGRVELSA